MSIQSIWNAGFSAYAKATTPEKEEKPEAKAPAPAQAPASTEAQQAPTTEAPAQVVSTPAPAPTASEQASQKAFDSLQEAQNINTTQKQTMDERKEYIRRIQEMKDSGKITSNWSAEEMYEGGFRG